MAGIIHTIDTPFDHVRTAYVTGKYPPLTLMLRINLIRRPQIQIITAKFWPNWRAAERSDDRGIRVQLRAKQDGATELSGTSEDYTLHCSPVCTFAVLHAYCIYYPKASTGEIYEFAYSAFGADGHGDVDAAIRTAFAAINDADEPGEFAYFKTSQLALYANEIAAYRSGPVQ